MPLIRNLIFGAMLLFCFTTGLQSYAQSENFTERIGLETDIDMILVRGGTFEMGSSNREEEQPIHTVSLNSYFMSKYEITQKQWYAVMKYNYCHFDNCPNCPVEMVSWNDAQEFISKLNKLIANHYRLPTEAEWEYAARGGAKSKHYVYSGGNNLNDVGWCPITGRVMTDADRRTFPVGDKQPNELGIYDMSGNVLEWCSDWYDSAYYKQKVANNPQGPATGKYKVHRGGSFISFPYCATPTYRSIDADHASDTAARWITLGFRIVRDNVK
jgi:sulfatase modifying factor 1